MFDKLENEDFMSSSIVNKNNLAINFINANETFLCMLKNKQRS